MLLCTVRSREPQHQRHFRGSWKCRVQLPPDLVNHNLYFNKTSCGSVALSRSVSYAPDGAAKLTSTVSNNDIWRSQELASGFRGSGCSCLMTLFSVICTNSSDSASHFCCLLNICFSFSLSLQTRFLWFSSHIAIWLAQIFRSTYHLPNHILTINSTPVVRRETLTGPT